MRLLLTAVVIAVSLSIDLNALAVVALLFAIVVPFERLFPRHRQRLRRPAVATDLAYALSAPILQVLGTAGAILVSVLSLFWLPALVLRPAVEALPDGLRIALGILLFDLVSYWAHRFAHEIPAGWRFHKVHHSTEQLDLSLIHISSAASTAPEESATCATGSSPVMACTTSSNATTTPPPS